jgi:hypothetical protein
MLTVAVEVNIASSLAGGLFRVWQADYFEFGRRTISKHLSCPMKAIFSVCLKIAVY